MHFNLRRVNAQELVNQAADSLPQAGKGPITGKVLDDALLADVFGLEMVEVAPAVKPATRRSKPAAAQLPAKKAAKPKAAAHKPATSAKTVKLAPGKEAVALKAPVKATIAPREASADKPAELKTSTQTANSPAMPSAQAGTAKVRPRIKSR